MALDLIMSDVQSHAPLISNECADWLAKHGASSSDALKSWIFCPPQLHRSLLDDALGVAHLRL